MKIKNRIILLVIQCLGFYMDYYGVLIKKIEKQNYSLRSGRDLFRRDDWLLHIFDHLYHYARGWREADTDRRNEARSLRGLGRA